MSARILAAGFSFLILVAGCDRDHHHPEESPHADEAPPAAEDHAAIEGANLLRLAPEMLRDLRITTAAAEARPGGEAVTALGELRVDERRYAEVGTPMAARLMKIYAAGGDPVDAGQPLAEIQSVEIGQARAEYLRARAREQLARQALRRKQGLAAERIAPQREVQEAAAEASAAAAELDAARAALAALGVGEESAADRGAALTLRAPIAGVIIERKAVAGQMADPAVPLFRIADLSHLWLVVHAFERDAVRLRAGAAARVSFPALPGRNFAGTVALIGQEVEIASRTVPVRIEIANDDRLLRPGMSATAFIPLQDGGAPIIAVPAAAVQRLREQWCVFLPREAGLFEIRAVGRGRDLGGEVEILNGLAAGERVAVDGAFLLKAEAERGSGESDHHDH